MIETITNIFSRKKSKKELHSEAMRLHYNYFRQVIRRTSDGYHEIAGYKEKSRSRLLSIFLESKIKEAYGR